MTAKIQDSPVSKTAMATSNLHWSLRLIFWYLRYLSWNLVLPFTVTYDNVNGLSLVATSKFFKVTSVLLHLLSFFEVFGLVSHIFFDLHAQQVNMDLDLFVFVATLVVWVILLFANTWFFNYQNDGIASTFNSIDQVMREIANLPRSEALARSSSAKTGRLLCSHQKLFKYLLMTVLILMDTAWNALCSYYWAEESQPLVDFLKSVCNETLPIELGAVCSIFTIWRYIAVSFLPFTSNFGYHFPLFVVLSLAILVKNLDRWFQNEVSVHSNMVSWQEMLTILRRLNTALDLSSQLIGIICCTALFSFLPSHCLLLKRLMLGEVRTLQHLLYFAIMTLVLLLASYVHYKTQRIPRQLSKRFDSCIETMSPHLKYQHKIFVSQVNSGQFGLTLTFFTVTYSVTGTLISISIAIMMIAATFFADHRISVDLLDYRIPSAVRMSISGSSYYCTPKSISFVPILSMAPLKMLSSKPSTPTQMHWSIRMFHFYLGFLSFVGILPFKIRYDESRGFYLVSSRLRKVLVALLQLSAFVECLEIVYGLGAQATTSGTQKFLNRLNITLWALSIVIFTRFSWCRRDALVEAMNSCNRLICRAVNAISLANPSIQKKKRSVSSSKYIVFGIIFAGLEACWVLMELVIVFKLYGLHEYNLTGSAGENYPKGLVAWLYSWMKLGPVMHNGIAVCLSYAYVCDVIITHFGYNISLWFIVSTASSVNEIRLLLQQPHFDNRDWSQILKLLEETKQCLDLQSETLGLIFCFGTVIFIPSYAQILPTMLRGHWEVVVSSSPYMVINFVLLGLASYVHRQLYALPEKILHRSRHLLASASPDLQYLHNSVVSQIYSGHYGFTFTFFTVTYSFTGAIISVILTYSAIIHQSTL